MKQKRHKPEEIIRMLREADSSDLNQEAFCRQKQISIATLQRWRKKYGLMSETDAKRLKTLEKENAELKKMFAEAMLGIKVLKEAIEKALSPAHRRDLARQTKKKEGCSQRQTCRIFELNRSTYGYDAKFPSPYRCVVEQAIVRLSQEYPEWGADKIGRLVRNENLRVNNDRVRFVRRQEGLQVTPPKKKQRRFGQSTGKHPQKASYPGHVWP